MDIAFGGFNQARDYSHIEIGKKLTLYRIFFTEMLKDDELGFLKDDVIKYGLLLLLEERPQTGEVRKRIFNFLENRLEMIFDEVKQELTKKQTKNINQ